MHQSQHRAEAPDQPAGHAANEGEAPPPPSGSPSERPWGSDHFVNIRLSIPLIFARFYLTIVAGKEQRDPARLARERRKNRLTTPGNMMFLSWWGVVISLALLAILSTAAVLYVKQLFDVELLLR